MKRVLAKSGVAKTYVVISVDGPDKIVRSDHYVNSGGSIRFYVGDKIVAEFQSDEVVGIERKS